MSLRQEYLDLLQILTAKSDCRLDCIKLKALCEKWSLLRLIIVFTCSSRLDCSAQNQADNNLHVAASIIKRRTDISNQIAIEELSFQ